MVASFNVRAWADAIPSLASRVRVFFWRPLARRCRAGGSPKGAEHASCRGLVREDEQWSRPHGRPVRSIRVQGLPGCFRTVKHRV